MGGSDAIFQAIASRFQFLAQLEGSAANFEFR
jgi:hypothetical protein